MKQRPKFRINDVQTDDKNSNKNNVDGIEMVTKTHNEIPTVETPIQEDDTLQAISIRYHCPVAELKRLNNLHRENEIFARRTIKVPYRAFLVAAVHKSGDSSPDGPNLTKKSVDANVLKQKLTSVTSTSSNSNGVVIDRLVDIESNNINEDNVNRIVFNTRLTPVENNDEAEEVVSDEEVQLLPKVEVAEPVSSDFSCSGADWGLSWPILLAIILVVAFVGPIIYIIYIAEHPEKYHHHR